MNSILFFIVLQSALSMECVTSIVNRLCGQQPTGQRTFGRRLTLEENQQLLLDARSNEVRRTNMDIQTDSSKFHISIVDNSGSMKAHDGRIFTDNGRQTRTTRYKEVENMLQKVVKYNIERGMPSLIYLMNPKEHGIWKEDADYISIQAVTEESVKEYSQEIELKIQKLFSHGPHNGTPLHAITGHVADLVDRVTNEGDQISVTIFTDGEPHPKSDFESNLKKLTENIHHVVHVPLYVATDQESIFDYYNNLDGVVSTLDVLDDFKAEGDEVRRLNPWVKYSLPLHIARTAGLAQNPMVDMLDEKRLNPRQIYKFILNSRKAVDGKEDLVPGFETKEERDELRTFLLENFVGDSDFLNVDEVIRLLGEAQTRPGSHQSRDNSTTRNECKICMEDSVHYSALIPCGHMLCGTCVNRINNSCPICRRHVTGNVRTYEP